MLTKKILLGALTALSLILVLNFVLVAGFTVLAQSSFKSNADMGVLTALIIFIALVVNFLFLPPLLMLLDKSENNISGSSGVAVNAPIKENITTA